MRISPRVTLALAAMLLIARPTRSQTTILVSAAPSGQASNSESVYPSISGDAQCIAFASSATNLVSGDTNGQMDIFVRERLTNQTTLGSLSSEGSIANGESLGAAVSGDGRYVGFTSLATNLVSEDTNGVGDVFVRDRLTNATTRVSVSTAGTQANAECGAAVISADGRFVAFLTTASNLVVGDDNSLLDIYVHDIATGETALESVSSLGAVGSMGSADCSLSSDGRYLAFSSYSPNLVTNDTNATSDVFVRDRETGITALVSVSADGTQGNQHSYYPSISGDGRFIAFVSYATNLAPNDSNNTSDIFVHDRQAGDTIRVSVSSTGLQANDASGFIAPSISATGRYVVFNSFAANLVPNDTNSDWDIFRRDCETGETVCVSFPPSSGGLQGDCTWGNSISSDGRVVAFCSRAGLLPSDTNGLRDVYLRDDFPWTSVGVGMAGQAGVPKFAGSGTLEPSTPVTLALTAAHPFAPAYLIVGFVPINMAFKGGVLVPSPDVMFMAGTDGLGHVLFSGTWPPGVPSGVVLYFQWWIVDAAGPHGFAASNAVSGTTP